MRELTEQRVLLLCSSALEGFRSLPRCTVDEVRTWEDFSRVLPRAHAATVVVGGLFAAATRALNGELRQLREQVRRPVSAR